MLPDLCFSRNCVGSTQREFERGCWEKASSRVSAFTAVKSKCWDFLPSLQINNPHCDDELCLNSHHTPAQLLKKFHLFNSPSPFSDFLLHYFSMIFLFHQNIQSAQKLINFEDLTNFTGQMQFYIYHPSSYYLAIRLCIH